MRTIVFVLVLLLIAAEAPAQPGPPGPPGPRRGAAAEGSAPTGAPQYVVGTVDYLSSTKLTVKRQPTSSGQPVTNMDFTVDEKSRVTQGIQSQDRVVVVYEVSGGTTLYRAVMAVKCPAGSNPEDVIKAAR